MIVFCEREFFGCGHGNLTFQFYTNKIFRSRKTGLFHPMKSNDFYKELTAILELLTGMSYLYKLHE